MIQERLNLKRVAFIGPAKAWNHFVLENIKNSNFISTQNKIITNGKEIRWIKSKEQACGLEFDEFIVHETFGGTIDEFRSLFPEVQFNYSENL